ncbi:MAG TPA: DsbA family oxidoreductase [Ktedonobacterales bacterium]|nr:DsbA family oxidoreductase [Ktedonobacterales bacterium]
MKVEIWSDVVCPWCYIGKRRFESALAQFEHRDQVEVVWRSFQLDPQAPQHGEQKTVDMLAEKYGVSAAQAMKMQERVSTLAAEEGLEYHLDQTRHENTFDAHRLIHLAATHGLQAEAEERFFHAHFTEGKALGNNEALTQLAAEIGVPEDEARATLDSDAYADAVRADIRRARAFGVQGVPFFAIDEKYGVSGAQPAELLKDVLEQAWTDAHPLIKVGGTSEDDANACEGDNCAI